MVEKCVHFDIWNINSFENFKGSQYNLAHFSNFLPNPNLRNEPKEPFEIFKTIFIPNIKMDTFFHHKNDGGKMSGIKNETTVALQNVPDPYETPCTKSRSD